MDPVQIECPNPKCPKQLRIPVKPDQPDRKCRCPSCKTIFAMRVTAAPRPPKNEDPGGTYGFAEETSLSYLLQREQNGVQLSAEQKKAKKRLLREGLDENPFNCPACKNRIEDGDVICVSCGLNMKTGKRLTTKVELMEPEKSNHGDDRLDKVGEAVSVTIEILSLFGG